MVEDKEYAVEIVIRLKTVITFAPLERETPITEFDAIDNAVGLTQADVWNEIRSGFGGEFNVEMEFHVKERDW